MTMVLNDLPWNTTVTLWAKPLIPRGGLMALGDWFNTAWQINDTSTVSTDKSYCFLMFSSSTSDGVCVEKHLLPALVFFRSESSFFSCFSCSSSVWRKTSEPHMYVCVCVCVWNEGPHGLTVRIHTACERKKLWILFRMRFWTRDGSMESCYGSLRWKAANN